MKILASIAAVAALAFAGAATAAPASTTYVQATIGQDEQANRDGAVAFSASVGKDWGLVRGEVEYIGTRGARSPALGPVEANLGNVNLYVEPPVSFLKISSFVGAGVGYGNIKRTGVTGDNNGLVVNGTAGVTYPLTKKVDLVAQYRYFLANSVDIRRNVGTTEAYKASVISAGLRYTF